MVAFMGDLLYGSLKAIQQTACQKKGLVPSSEKTPAWSGRSIWLRDGTAAKDGASY
jgi:hypothetical protein